MLDTFLVMLVVAPAVVGAVLLLAAGAADRAAAAVSVATSALLAVLTVPVALAAPSGPGVSMPVMAGSELALGVDGLAAVVLPAVAVVSVLVLISSTGTPALRTARFHGLMLLFLAAVLMTVMATTLPALLLAWEVMGATSFALIGYHWRDQETVGSGTTAFLTTRAADLGLYVAAGAALAGGAGLGLESLADTSSGWRDVVAGGLLVAGLGKAAQLPFSFWLSRAMHGPSPVSALLHSAAMVAMGTYLLLRVSPLLSSTGWAADAAAWAGAATAVVLGVVAVAQSDLKQLLAASTAAQLGFVVLAAGLGATTGGTTHLVAHAAVKAGLFLSAGIWLEALGTKRLASLTGAARLWPVTGACAGAALLSLAGLPPFALWVTKDTVLAAAAKDSPALYAAGLLGAGLSAAYATKALVVLTRRPRGDGEPGRDQERSGTRVVPGASWSPLLPLALGAVLLGVLGLPAVFTALHDLLGGAAPQPAVGELAVSAVLAVSVVLATVVAMRNRTDALGWPPVIVDWLRLEVAAHRLVVRPVEVLARRCAQLDDTVLDRAVEGTGRAAVRLAARSARIDDGTLDEGVGRLATGVRRLGDVVRRPQTGRLHEYYLQALTALAVVVLVLVLVLVR